MKKLILLFILAITPVNLFASGILEKGEVSGTFSEEITTVSTDKKNIRKLEISYHAETYYGMIKLTLTPLDKKILFTKDNQPRLIIENSGLREEIEKKPKKTVKYSNIDLYEFVAPDRPKSLLSDIPPKPFKFLLDTKAISHIEKSGITDSSDENRSSVIFYIPYVFPYENTLHFELPLIEPDGKNLYHIAVKKSMEFYSGEFEDFEEFYSKFISRGISRNETDYLFSALKNIKDCPKYWRGLIKQFRYYSFLLTVGVDLKITNSNSEKSFIALIPEYIKSNYLINKDHPWYEDLIPNSHEDNRFAFYLRDFLGPEAELKILRSKNAMQRSFMFHFRFLTLAKDQDSTANEKEIIAVGAKKTVVDLPFHQPNWYQKAIPQVFLYFLFCEMKGKPILGDFYADLYSGYDPNQLAPISSSLSNSIGSSFFDYTKVAPSFDALYTYKKKESELIPNYKKWINQKGNPFVENHTLKFMKLPYDYDSYKDNQFKLSTNTFKLSFMFPKDTKGEVLAANPSRVEIYSSGNILMGNLEPNNQNLSIWKFPDPKTIKYLVYRLDEENMEKLFLSKDNFFNIELVTEGVDLQKFKNKKVKKIAKYTKFGEDYILIEIIDPEMATELNIRQFSGGQYQKLDKPNLLLGFESHPISFIGQDLSSISLSYLHLFYERSEKSENSIDQVKIKLPLFTSIYKSDNRVFPPDQTQYNAWFKSDSGHMLDGQISDIRIIGDDGRLIPIAYNSNSNPSYGIIDELLINLPDKGNYIKWTFSSGSSMLHLDQSMRYSKMGNDTPKIYNAKLLSSMTFAANQTNKPILGTNNESDLLKLRLDSKWSYLDRKDSDIKTINTSLDLGQYPFCIGPIIPIKNGFINDINSPYHLGKIAGIDSLGLLSQKIGLAHLENNEIIISPSSMKTGKTKDELTAESYSFRNKQRVDNNYQYFKDIGYIKDFKNATLPNPNDTKLISNLQDRISEDDLDAITVPVIDILSIRPGDLLIGRESGETVVGIIYKSNIQNIDWQVQFRNPGFMKNVRQNIYVCFVSRQSGQVSFGRWEGSESIFGGFTMNPENYSIRRLVSFKNDKVLDRTVMHPGEMITRQVFINDLLSSSIKFYPIDNIESAPIKFISKGIYGIVPKYQHHLGKLKVEPRFANYDIKKFDLKLAYGGDAHWPLTVEIFASNGSTNESVMKWEHDLTPLSFNPSENKDGELKKLHKWRNEQASIPLVLNGDTFEWDKDGKKGFNDFYLVTYSKMGSTEELLPRKYTIEPGNFTEANNVQIGDQLIFKEAPNDIIIPFTLLGDEEPIKNSLNISRIVMQEIRPYLKLRENVFKVDPNIFIEIDQKIFILDEGFSRLIQIDCSEPEVSQRSGTNYKPIPPAEKILEYFFYFHNKKFYRNITLKAEVLLQSGELFFSNLRGSFSAASKELAALGKDPFDLHGTPKYTWRISKDPQPEGSNIDIHGGNLNFDYNKKYREEYIKDKSIEKTAADFIFEYDEAFELAWTLYYINFSNTTLPYRANKNLNKEFDVNDKALNAFFEQIFNLINLVPASKLFKGGSPILKKELVEGMTDNYKIMRDSTNLDDKIAAQKKLWEYKKTIEDNFPRGENWKIRFPKPNKPGLPLDEIIKEISPDSGIPAEDLFKILRIQGDSNFNGKNLKIVIRVRKKTTDDSKMGKHIVNMKDEVKLLKENKDFIDNYDLSKSNFKIDGNKLAIDVDQQKGFKKVGARNLEIWKDLIEMNPELKKLDDYGLRLVKNKDGTIEFAQSDLDIFCFYDKNNYVLDPYIKAVIKLVSFRKDPQINKAFSLRLESIALEKENRKFLDALNKELGKDMFQHDCNFNAAQAYESFARIFIPNLRGQKLIDEWDSMVKIDKAGMMRKLKELTKDKESLKKLNKDMSEIMEYDGIKVDTSNLTEEEILFNFIDHYRKTFKVPYEIHYDLPVPTNESVLILLDGLKSVKKNLSEFKRYLNVDIDNE